MNLLSSKKNAAKFSAAYRSAQNLPSPKSSSDSYEAFALRSNTKSERGYDLREFIILFSQRQADCLAKLVSRLTGTGDLGE